MGYISYFLKYAEYQQVVDFTDRVSWLFSSGQVSVGVCTCLQVHHTLHAVLFSSTALRFDN